MRLPLYWMLKDFFGARGDAQVGWSWTPDGRDQAGAHAHAGGKAGHGGFLSKQTRRFG
jgi:hypothetical protein